MITYIPVKNNTEYIVKLDGRTVGHIKLRVHGTLSGWCYFPKGQREGGKIFPTLGECKQSLESDQ